MITVFAIEQVRSVYMSTGRHVNTSTRTPLTCSRAWSRSCESWCWRGSKLRRAGLYGLYLDLAPTRQTLVGLDEKGEELTTDLSLTYVHPRDDSQLMNALGRIQGAEMDDDRTSVTFESADPEVELQEETEYLLSSQQAGGRIGVFRYDGKKFIATGESY